MKTVSGEVIKEGPVVAVQYPSVVPFTSGVEVGKELAETYGHLKQLDPDSHAQYDELTEAIKAVVKRRTDIEKEEDVIKKPLNAFRKKVIDTGKKIYAAIAPIETDLKNEKQRIDNIRQEKLEAQEKLWKNNLEKISFMANSSAGLVADRLPGHLEMLKGIDLDTYDLGDLIEDAKVALARAKAIAEEGIAREAQRVKLAAEQAAFKKQQEEAAEKQRIIDDAAAEVTRLANEKAAAQQKKIDDLEARAEEFRKQAEPAPEPEFDHTHEGDYKPEPKGASLAGIASACGIPLNPETTKPAVTANAKDSGGKVIGVSSGFKVDKPDTSDFDDDPIAVQVSAEDVQKLATLSISLNALIDNAPVDFENDNCSKAVHRVMANINNASRYLDRVAEGGEA